MSPRRGQRRRNPQREAVRKMRPTKKDYPQCPAGCGKVAYPTDWEAGRIIVLGKGESRIYYCEKGRCWHATSKPHRYLDRPPRSVST